MRVAYICTDPGVPVFGRKGSSIHVQAIIRALLRRGMDVELFASRFDGERPSDCGKVRLHALSRPPKGDLAAREQMALAANHDLRVALEAEGPFDLVYERYALWSFAGMEYAQAINVPGMLEVNAPLIEEQAAHRGLADRAGAEAVAGRVFGAATALLAVSDGVATYLETHPAARGRVHVLANGVDPDRFPPDLVPELPREPGSFTIGFVGTLKPWHGLDTLLAAFDTLHECDKGMRLLIVGDGPERETLEVEASTRGLADAVIFMGAVDPARIPGLLASMDVATAPYPALDHFYFSPLKVYEYMAAGVCVVASRVGQLAELIRDDSNGVLYSPGDVEALVVSLRQLRADPERHERLGAAGRATVIGAHTWDSVAARMLELAGVDVEWSS